MKWTVVPAEGQHQNGLSESLIKSVKRSLKHTIGDHTLTFAQLQMVLFEISNIINSRPIGVISGSDPTDPKPLTPNDLLLGRSTGEVPQGPFDTSGKALTRRFRFLQELVTNWWENWYRVVLPTLVPCYKWMQRHRNVQVGDVCLIRYGKDKHATYGLGRVEEVKRGADGLVRKVSLKYKLPGEKTFRTVDRPIQGIAVVVPVEEQSNTEIVHADPVINNNKNMNVPVINELYPVSGGEGAVLEKEDVDGPGSQTAVGSAAADHESSETDPTEVASYCRNNIPHVLNPSATVFQPHIPSNF